MRQVFISHSGSDSEIIKEIVAYFDGTGIRPVLMENERWETNYKPAWNWIKKEIEKSDALFVVLTKGVTSKPQTQNWVAFEIGVAAECNPPKNVCVIREQDDVIFPVPYLNYYIPFSMSKLRKDKTWTMDNPTPRVLFNLMFGFILQELTSKNKFVSVSVTTEPVSTHHITCPHCQIKYDIFYPLADKITCPSCYQNVQIPKDKKK